MILFDMDNTLLEGRFIDKAADQLGFTSKLAMLRTSVQDAGLRTRQIAALLKGVSKEIILEIAAGIPLVPDAEAVITTLRERGYITGIVSDSYDCVTQEVQSRLNMEFALSNQLQFDGGQATGVVTIPGYFQKNGTVVCEHDICKSYAVLYIAGLYKVQLADIIAVGDSENDICMLQSAGTGVAFCSENTTLNAIANYQITTKTFMPLLQYGV